VLPETTRARRTAGFTLVETLTVVLLVGILTGVMVPNYRKAVEKARATAIVEDIYTVRLAVHTFASDRALDPSAPAGSSVETSLGPYLPGGFSFQTEDYSMTLEGAGDLGRPSGILALSVKVSVNDPGVEAEVVRILDRGGKHEWEPEIEIEGRKGMAR